MTDTIAAPAASIEIQRIGRQTLIVPIKGVTPLIVHRFSEKSKRQMLEAQQGVKRHKENRDPKADYEASLYRYLDPADGAERYGFPAIAFKSAMISAARLFGKSVTMTSLRQAVFVSGVMGVDGQQLAPIDGDPEMREDVVRLGISGTDLRYRPMFAQWSTLLEVTYVSNLLSQDSVLSLIDAGGLTVGVGEWRPEKDGEFGMFQIDGDREVMEVPGR